MMVMLDTNEDGVMLDDDTFGVDVVVLMSLSQPSGAGGEGQVTLTSTNYRNDIQQECNRSRTIRSREEQAGCEHEECREMLTLIVLRDVMLC